jgi:hypothetical protein
MDMSDTLFAISFGTVAEFDARSNLFNTDVEIAPTSHMAMKQKNATPASVLIV